ncbi:MAG TPA: tRNA preQ1(34) S-adenosylmethionine ribosyltransferase-isomerase QueA [Lentisphaeria bacterium]|nr:tRNA preQ1(34) S-adenosylmethionine ribosyltransferase-isomerase QueA [Lentisphaeria bacterium]
MKVSDFYYDLPEELIAQHPASHRSDSEMLVLERRSGAFSRHGFIEFPQYLRSGDCLVINDTRVLCARLWGHRAQTGGRVQAFLLTPAAGGEWTCMLRPGRRLPPGARVELEAAAGSFVVTRKNQDGTFQVRFDVEDVFALMERAGQIPLPPYIDREPLPEDRERYQTVYASTPGAVAAPTAGLHFTSEMLAGLEARGVKIARLTLHVGAGTFKPVSVERVEDHLMHAENYCFSAANAELINSTRQEGGRIICVGTTTVRVLETCFDPASGMVKPGSGQTSIFLHPPHRSRVADGLLTNFHLPQSTLLMLVCTFADHAHVMKAYDFAVRSRMRFYSYGDCMLLI